MLITPATLVDQGTYPTQPYAGRVSALVIEDSLADALKRRGSAGTGVGYHFASLMVIMDATYDLYLDLISWCLTDWIYDGVGALARAEGRDWPARAHTMIGLKRLANIRTYLEAVLDAGIPGDKIATGVWRGGASIFHARHS